MRIDPQTDRAMIDALRAEPSVGPHIRRPWLQLLSAVLGLAGPHAGLLRHAERAWASVTFSGTRHTIELQFNGAYGVADAERFIEVLPEHEFDLSRHIVADANVVAMQQSILPAPHAVVEIEILLLDDC